MGLGLQVGFSCVPRPLVTECRNSKDPALGSYRRPSFTLLSDLAYVLWSCVGAVGISPGVLKPFPLIPAI